jgi:hypothetical protein
MILLPITIILLIGSRPLNATDFVFCTDIVKPYSIIIWFNLRAEFCGLSSVLDIMTWSSANNNVNSCLCLESGIPVIYSFCHLVIISSNYILNSVGEEGKPWRISLWISARFGGLELNFIDILFCVCMPTIAFNNVSGIFLDFRI